MQAKRDVAVPVTVGKVIRRSEPLELRAIGNVQPYSTVQVKAEVGGELVGVYFKEGQFVRRGQVLFRIDPRTYQAVVNQMVANRARDAAQAATAETDAQRYLALYQKGIISRQQYDQQRTAADALKATVAADDAQIENARLQLGYTEIRSPIDGRTGNLLVQQGNLIKSNDVPLVIINQVQPIYVSAAIPAQNLADIKQYMSAHPLEVRAVPNDGSPPQSGVLTFIDNNVDVTTGTIQIKGTFNNRDRVLWPGQFVNVTLVLSIQPAVVVPSAAVQTSQQGQFVYVVNPDMHVESRPIAVSRTVGQDTVVQRGLQPGETVVTDGQLRLTPGAKVTFAPPVAAGGGAGS